MKRLLFAALLFVVATGAIAQTTDSVKTTSDTVKAKKRSFKLSVGKGEDTQSLSINQKDTTYHAHRAPGFSWGLTFSRFDLGLATLIDNGSFTLSPQNDFLD